MQTQSKPGNKYHHHCQAREVVQKGEPLFHLLLLVGNTKNLVNSYH